nr:structural protein [Tolivirales sp.]
MPKKTKNKVKTKKANAKPMPRRPVMGPVSVIDTAPVSIGNSLRGAQSRVINTADGARVLGRDFCFTAGATVAGVNMWIPTGGMPLTPACLPSTILRNFVQMYNKFKINAIQVHYITSSATSQTGDIMFYYEKDRTSPFIDFTNNSFLPFVLSDPNTVIGPQWTNHSLLIKPTDGYNSCNYGLNEDLNEDTCGSIFLFSKTSSASSPGYIVMDYDITFKELSVNPRAGILPVSRAQFSYLTLRVYGLAKTLTSPFFVSALGNNPDGTATSLPTGTTNGDVFKCVALVTASTVSGVNAAWVNVTPSNLVAYNQGLTGTGETTSAIAMDDGFTFYVVYTNNGLTGYPTLANAITNTNPLYFGVAATITFNLCTMASLVYSTSAFLQSSY